MLTELNHWGTALIAKWSSLLACPNCKDSLDDRLSEGFAWSIGLMISFPMLIIAGWGIAIVWFARSRR